MIDKEPPTPADLREWLLKDQPSLRGDRFDFNLLEEGAFKRFLEHATMPLAERGCIEIIMGCIECNLPTVMRRFLEHSNVPITALNLSFWENSNSVFNEALASAMVDGLIKPRCKELRAIGLHDIRIRDEKAIETLCEGIKLCTALESVLIETDVDVSTLAFWNALAASRATLASLALIANWNNATIADVAVQIEHMPHLRSLKLSVNSWGYGTLLQPRDRLKGLAAALKKNPLLETLSLSDTQFRFAPIFKAIAGNTHLKALDLGFCVFEDADDWTALTDLIRSNAVLTSLDMGGIKIIEAVRIRDGSRLQSLVQALKANKTLQHLNLTKWSVDVKSIAPVIDALKTHKALIELKLSLNAIDAAGLASLVALLEQSSLDAIELSHCELDDHGCEQVLRAAAKNTRLKHLDLSHNIFGPAACTAAGELLKTSKTLRTLDLSSCWIDDAGLTALSPGLIDNGVLQKLDLQSNFITDEGLPVLQRALESRMALVELLVGWNDFDAARAATIFERAMEKNNSVATLDYHRFENAVHSDWSAINNKLLINAKLGNPATQKYMLTVLSHFAVVKMGFMDIGVRLWGALREAIQSGGDSKDVRAALRLTEVSRAIAFTPNKAGRSAAAQRTADELLADADRAAESAFAQQQ